MQSQVRFNRICGHLTYGNPAEVFPALGFAARFRKICKNKTLRLLGIPPKFFLSGPNFVRGGRNQGFGPNSQGVRAFFVHGDLGYSI